MEKAITGVDPQGAGTLILVDMLGGTPFNVAIRLATQRKIGVLTGVNLPMLIKALSHREEPDLDQLCADIQGATRDGVVTSVELLKRKSL
jgi:PTS system mannose-specific IIA component